MDPIRMDRGEIPRKRPIRVGSLGTPKKKDRGNILRGKYEIDRLAVDMKIEVNLTENIHPT